MTKKKQRKSKVQRLKPYFLPVALIMSAVIIAGAIVYVNTKEDTKTDQTSESSKNMEATLSNPRVSEAKVAADKYFEALHNCDLKTANSMRFLPKDDIDTNDDAANKDLCKKDCAGSPTFRFVEVNSYKNEMVDGEQVELVVLGYLVTCGNTTRSTGVIMSWEAEQKKWLLFGTI